MIIQTTIPLGHPEGLLKGVILLLKGLSSSRWRSHASEERLDLPDTQGLELSLREPETCSLSTGPEQKNIDALETVTSHTFHLEGVA